MPLLVIVARSPCPADHDWAQRRPLVAPAFIEKKSRGFDHPLPPVPSVLSSNTSDATRAAERSSSGSSGSVSRTSAPSAREMSARPPPGVSAEPISNSTLVGSELSAGRAIEAAASPASGLNITRCVSETMPM